MPDAASPDAPTASYATMDMCIDQNSQRCSTYHAFLPPRVLEDRKDRLKICTNTIVTRLEFSTGANIRTAGVHFETTSYRHALRSYFAKARREIVLCAGALGTPQILMLRCGDSLHEYRV